MTMPPVSGSRIGHEAAEPFGSRAGDLARGAHAIPNGKVRVYPVCNEDSLHNNLGLICSISGRSDRGLQPIVALARPDDTRHSG